ncbi:MAG TPA: hypothetical protein VLK27_07575, partial [Chthoniobacterales bacterium]|nr:hypothetical protein [Chthoniobacterales bacterium]
MPTSIGAVPTPIYGEAAIRIYAVYFVVAFLVLIVSYWRDVRKAAGRERIELSFILIGGVAAMAVALLITFVADLFISQSQWMWFAPFRMIIFSLIIAYGIATRKIMDVGVLLRRIISYTLLCGYLLALYALVWWLTATALHSS